MCYHLSYLLSYMYLFSQLAVRLVIKFFVIFLGFTFVCWLVHHFYHLTNHYVMDEFSCLCHHQFVLYYVFLLSVHVCKFVCCVWLSCCFHDISLH